ncbi:MAG: phosphonate C-P lyase system protein PhnH [Actinomycetota bacterium]
MTVGIPLAGFADAVHDAQSTFRAVLDALARPARAVTVPATPDGPAELTAAARAVLLALCDEATPLWLNERTPELEAWLSFHTGAPLADDLRDAAFAVVSAPAALPGLRDFAQGTDETPHRSATVIVVDAEGLPGETYLADGPGFEHPLRWMAPPFAAGFAEQWAANHARFPRGVDLIIAGAASVTGLPRTTRLER